MAIVFALIHLFDAIQERFAVEGVDVPMYFGWLKSAEQHRAQRRIVCIPGDAGGSVGAIGPAKYPGMTPNRTLLTLNELSTWEITAFDDRAETDERAQYQAVRELYDAWLRAVYLAARGTFHVQSSAWVGGDRVRRAGATVRVVLSIQAPITDQPSGDGIDNVTATRARITVAELDRIETIDVQSS